MLEIRDTVVFLIALNRLYCNLMRLTWREYRTIMHNSLFVTSFLILPFWILQQFDTKFIYTYSFTLFYNILLNGNLSSAHRFDLQKNNKICSKILRYSADVFNSTDLCTIDFSNFFNSSPLCSYSKSDSTRNPAFPKEYEKSFT